MIEIDDLKLDINYREELQLFEWDKAEWREEKLMACSPFRDETRTSFYCYLEDTETASAGNWGDAGAFDPDWERGGFIKLLSYLRQESTDDVIEYLKERYAVGYVRKTDLKLQPHPKMRLVTGFRPMDPKILENLRYKSNYLDGRGISEAVQRNRDIQTGFDPQAGAVSIPWFNPKGQLITIKFRSTRSKFFWYHDEGADIRPYLWGMNTIYRYRPQEVGIVEAEIDALWLISCGIPAVATGNKYFNKERADQIVKAGINRLVLFQDNDKAGDLWKQQITNHLQGRVDLANWQPPGGVKDVNDVRDKDRVRSLKETAIDITHQHKTLFLSKIEKSGQASKQK